MRAEPVQRRMRWRWGGGDIPQVVVAAEAVIVERHGGLDVQGRGARSLARNVGEGGAGVVVVWLVRRLAQVVL